MERPQLLFVFRHGSKGFGDALSEIGKEQMWGLKRIVDALIAKTFGEKKVKRTLFSFSHKPRAFQSVRELSSRGEGIVVKDLYLARRDEISGVWGILDSVVAVADVYDASVIIIVAHGDMPAVITETAHEIATNLKLEKELPAVEEACGYVINMDTGDIKHLRFDTEIAPRSQSTGVVQQPVPVPVKAPEIAAAPVVATSEAPRKRRKRPESPTPDLFGEPAKAESENKTDIPF